MITESHLNHVKILNTLTLGSPIRNHIEENSEAFKEIKNLAVSNKIRYSKNMKYAYIHLIPNVESAFEVTDKQILTGTYTVRLKRNRLTGVYKIEKFVDEVPNVYLMMFERNKFR